VSRLVHNLSPRVSRRGAHPRHFSRPVTFVSWRNVSRKNKSVRRSVSSSRTRARQYRNHRLRIAAPSRESPRFRALRDCLVLFIIAIRSMKSISCRLYHAQVPCATREIIRHSGESQTGLMMRAFRKKYDWSRSNRERKRGRGRKRERQRYPRGHERGICEGKKRFASRYPVISRLYGRV